MGRVIATVFGVLILALMAAGLTEVTLAMGSRSRTSEDVPVVAHVARATPSPTATPVSNAAATPTATPSPTPSATPSGPVATTNSFVHMRAGNSTNSAILYNLDGGTVVKLLPYVDSTWQQVEYSGATGYIYKAYLTY